MGTQNMDELTVLLTCAPVIIKWGFYSVYFHIILEFFWDYNVTTFFSFLSSLQTSCMYTPLPCSPSDTCLHFSLIVTAFTYVYVYTCVFLNMTCSVCKMLLACAFSGLTTWHRTTHWHALPCGRPPLLLPVLLSPPCRFEASSCLIHLLVPSCSAHIWPVMLVRLHGCSFSFY